jgi:DNA-binding MarR family transcriptional regulator
VSEVDPNACNCTGLKRASRRVSLFYDRYLAPCGLTSGQVAILAAISSWPDGRSPPLGELARALAMDRAALTHTLQPLVRDGLVEFGRDAADRRARLVQLTREGRKRLAEARPLWTAAQGCFEKTFGENQAIALRALLRIVSESAFSD